MSSPTVLYLIEILHQTTTNRPCCRRSGRCILSKFYIKPQRITPDYLNYQGCILSKFYIKPQLVIKELFHQEVVSYRNSTSNHNNATMSGGSASLYLIEILHQTTTEDRRHLSRTGLYLIEILHQTTTSSTFSWLSARCILSKFYIKPQLQNRRISISSVVSYRNSTSNHNIAFNDMLGRRLYLIEILHQTTTRCKTSNCR